MKRKHQKMEIHRFKKKAGWTNKHHLTPKSRDRKSETTIKLDVYRHDAWHLLFGNKTLSEIIEVLTYLRDRKMP